MTRWKSCAILAFALIFGALGCGSGAGSGVVLAISPVTASVILNTSQQFVSMVTGSTNTTVTWSITCPSGVTAPACGTIGATTGVYQAPGTLPATPTATITATAQADTTKVQTATITIVSGIAIIINPTTATVGTGEHTTFTASVSNPGCNSVSNPSCLNVTWSITSTAGIGSIDANGVFTAPSTLPSTPTVVVTATSVVDTAITANATVTIVTATDPTLSSVSPNTAALGSVFQNVFLTGTNLIATTKVYVNGALLDPSFVLNLSSSRLLARIPDRILAAPPPSGILQITASQQVGAQQSCTPEVSRCQVNVVPARPAVVGTSPDTVPQGNAGSINFNVNGGFFGTGGTVSPVPAVNATYDGQLRGLAVNPNNSARQLAVTIGGASNPNDFGTPGLHQIELRNATDPTKLAATNLAVQPDINANTPTPVSGSPFTVGTSPIDVAIDPATGVAVVANNGSNNVTLIDLTTTPSPTITAASICTGSLAPASPCPSSGPTSVAAAHIPTLAIGSQDVALVANGATKNVAVINLATRAVTALIPLQDAPAGVGINALTGRALVSMNQRGYGVLLDLTKAPPAVVGVVSISSGPNSHVAVEPHLNWALATPGGFGSLSIVDLNRQTVNKLASISRTSGTVTVSVQPSTTAAPQPPLGVQPGDAVSIQGVSPDSSFSFDGIYTVNSIGPGSSTFTYSQVSTTNPPDVATTTVTGTVSYSGPVATVGLSTSMTGIGINPETQQAVLTDPATGGFVTFFSLLNQTVSSLALEPGIVAGAIDPLTNVALVVNQVTDELSVLDPSTPKRLPTSTSTFVTGNRPSAIAIDPSSNLAVMANQNDNNVTIYSLGAIRPLQITDTFPKTFELDSTLSSAPTPPANVTLTILGSGFSGASTPRLDGTPLTPISVSANGRVLTATVPGAMLAGAHRFALDVQNPGVPPVLSNVSDFSVIQSVDVSSGTGCTTSPQPTDVAIDSQLGIAVVSLYGCSSVAVIDLSKGTGTTVPVGANPLGVAILTDIHSAVVANNGAGTASVVDYSGTGAVTATVSTGSGPFGVATDPGTDEAVVTNRVDNTATVLSVTPNGSSSTNTLSTGQQPIAAAFNYSTHEIAVAAAAGNSVGIGDAGGSSLGTSFSVAVPTSILYDPVANHFLVNSSTSNQLSILDPNTQQQTAFRIGINPTTMAYNYLTSTLVTTNQLSRTLTVIDFLDSTTTGTDRQVRAVLTLPAPPANSTLALTGQLAYGVDIHPFTNLAVVADTANGKVLFVPLPH